MKRSGETRKPFVLLIFFLIEGNWKSRTIALKMIPIAYTSLCLWPNFPSYSTRFSTIYNIYQQISAIFFFVLTPAFAYFYLIYFVNATHILHFVWIKIKCCESCLKKLEQHIFVVVGACESTSCDIIIQQIKSSVTLAVFCLNNTHKKEKMKNNRKIYKKLALFLGV